MPKVNHNYLARYYIEELFDRNDTSDEIFYFMREMKRDFKDFNQDKFTDALDVLFMRIYQVMREFEQEGEQNG
jgi:hypothetical protein